jgi:dihydropteroate synthase
MLQDIEQKLGRDTSAPKWSPRLIDLDLLAYDQLVLSEKELQIPHPELMNRPFLISLMASLHPHWIYPGGGEMFSGKTLAQIMHTPPFNQWQEFPSFVPSLQLVGIVNITPDSFSDGGHYLDPDDAIEQIEKLIHAGAAVIDLGAQSTRPAATLCSSEEEWQRLQPVLDRLRRNFAGSRAKPKISLDSFYPEVVEKALNAYPLDWINDVSGGQDLRLLEMAAAAGCTLLLNHSCSIPPSSTTLLPFDYPPIHYLSSWAKEKVDQLAALGVPPSQIILDPGIGFGKSPFQVLSLLRDIGELKKFGSSILVGHSRKSFLRRFSPQQPHPSIHDFATLGVAHFLLQEGVDYLRVHNVEAHQQALAAWALCHTQKIASNRSICCEDDSC